MTDWATFVGFTGLVLVSILVLAWLSQNAVGTALSGADDSSGTDSGGIESHDESSEPGEAVAGSHADRSNEDDNDPDRSNVAGNDPDRSNVADNTDQRSDDADGARAEEIRRFNRVMGGPAPAPDEPDPQQQYLDAAESSVPESLGSPAPIEHGADDHPHPRPSTALLLANVVLTQGLFFGVLVVGLWWTDVPAAAIGLAPVGTAAPVGTTSLGWGPVAIGLGVVFGLVLYVLNQLGAAAAGRFGVDSSTALREALAPSSAGGWAALLGVALPLVAVFEELLFRGVLIGGLVVATASLGLAVSPWLLVVASSVAFAIGHGAQGRGGIVVTGALGVALGGAFVLTWSLTLVVVAHYVVNAAEFVVHEGFDIEWV